MAIDNVALVDVVVTDWVRDVSVFVAGSSIVETAVMFVRIVFIIGVDASDFVVGGAALEIVFVVNGAIVDVAILRI